MSDRSAEGRTTTNVPSALASGEASQRTLLREGARWAGMAAVLQALPVPACALEPAGAPLPNGQQTGAGGPRVVLGNAALERLLNYEPETLGGCSLAQLWEGALPPDLGVEGQEGHARRSDGCLVPARLTVRWVGPEGRPPMLVATLEDLRQLRELQARLVGSERLAAQGALVAGVAHEVNNPANLLLANVHELEEALAELLPPEGLGPAQARLLREARVILADAREATQRIVDVVRDLVQFSHPDVAAAEPIDLGALVDVVLRLCRPVLRGVTVQRDLPAAPPVQGQRPRLFQVLLNLIINAVHAVEEVEQPRRMIWLRLRSAPLAGREGVRLQIEDSGCGIPLALQERVWDPFFTTKGAGRGTGLGLALARTLVEQHGGTLALQSRPGQGTQVSLWLPLEPPAGAAPGWPAIGSALLRRS